MNKAFEKILERLEELRQNQIKELCEHRDFTSEMQSMRGHNILQDAKKIVQEVAEEYNGGWIPCSDDSAKLPKENEKVRVTVWTGIERIGFRQYGKWYTYTSEGIGEATVVAWQPTEPFKERD